MVIAIHYFFKNPENIAKCFVIGVSFFFMSSFMQIPNMGNRHPLYLLDWLAYNRSKQFGHLKAQELFWYLDPFVLLALNGICYILYGFFVLALTMRVIIKNLKLFWMNAIHVYKYIIYYQVLSLALVFMTDNDLINNKFDLAVWFCNLFFYSTMRVYFLNS